MANTINTLYSDAAKTNAVYPRTKFSAVSDDNGNILGNAAVLNMTEVGSGTSAIQINAPVAIDTSKVLATFNATGGSTYTATENCFIIGKSYFPNIDGVNISSDTSASGDVRVCLFLKKGQKYYDAGYANWTSNYKVFGVK